MCASDASDCRYVWRRCVSDWIELPGLYTDGAGSGPASAGCHYERLRVQRLLRQSHGHCAAVRRHADGYQ